MSLAARTGEVRIGVALAVPPPAGPALHAARAGFGDPMAGAIPPHITLLPPTVVSGSELTAVCEHLSTVGSVHGAFTVHLRGTGTFRPVSDVVFVQVVRGISECERLERAIRSGPLDQELRFNYHPHVTVAHDLPEPDLDRAFTELAEFEAQYLAKTFSMFEHGDDGVWRPIAEFPLSATARE